MNTFGFWMYESWLEEDGGGTSSITYTFPPPAGAPAGTPTISTSISNRANDDNMGYATIQFTDPITTVYNISYAKHCKEELMVMP